MKAIVVKVGDIFNRWTVLREAEHVGYHRSFICRCKCGTVKQITHGPLRQGRSKSCGCVRDEITTKHGKHRTVEYRTWAHMNYRCSPKRKPDPSWKNYGGRGIMVCYKWRKSFVDFLTDVGPRPSVEHSIDRINNEKGYEPGNVRWATRAEQRGNKRMTIWERAIVLLGSMGGLQAGTIRDRVRNGMSDRELARWIAHVWKPKSKAALKTT